MNCGAIPARLLESELFGHEKGAFTGAMAQASDGLKRRTAAPCFWMKSAISRWNCNRNCYACCRRSNSNGWAAHRLQVDVRVVAATNRDLGQMVEERRFRADLYYRLNVFR